MSPISITMVMTTPNQMMSKCAARSAQDDRPRSQMIETGGRKKPSTTTRQDREQQPHRGRSHCDNRLRCDCEMCR